MSIPESQLETWANQGSVSRAKSTADSVKNALNYYDKWPENIEFQVYLQGSYKNSTNIRGDSDVDVVARLNSTFHNNLSDHQKKILGLTTASYQWEAYRADVLKALISYYGANQIVEGNKTLKVKAVGNRLPADVIACAQYREYNSVSHYDYVEGICFWTRNESRRIINYPKIHYDNGVSKHQDTNKWYKSVVRMFKNMRTHLLEDQTPSYFLECLIYNVPSPKFGKSYQDSFREVINWLSQCDNETISEFVCQNKQQKLFGNSPEQWNVPQAKKFIENAISLWNNF